jgi:Mg/Co/Ni transporter MgtE
MIYKQKFFYLCKVPLSAEGPNDVEIITRAEDNKDFPRVFMKYEELRSHAFNDDDLYSIVRADDVFDLIRTGTKEEAQEEAYEKAETEIVTNLRHRVIHNNDEDARAILEQVHDINVQQEDEEE